MKDIALNRSSRRARLSGNSMEQALSRGSQRCVECFAIGCAGSGSDWPSLDRAAEENRRTAFEIGAS